MAFVIVAMMGPMNETLSKMIVDSQEAIEHWKLLNPPEK